MSNLWWPPGLFASIFNNLWLSPLFLIVIGLWCPVRHQAISFSVFLCLFFFLIFQHVRKACTAKMCGTSFGQKSWRSRTTGQPPWKGRDLRQVYPIVNHGNSNKKSKWWGGSHKEDERKESNRCRWNPHWMLKALNTTSLEILTDLFNTIYKIGDIPNNLA